MVVNVLLAVTKGIAGVLGNSYALIADAVESTLDIIGSMVVWSGLRIAMTPPDDDHPYGHGKAEPLSANCRGAGPYRRGYRPRDRERARNQGSSP